jgi:hypothetical protein
MDVAKKKLPVRPKENKMHVSISAVPTVVSLGETVTVTYSCTGAQNTQLLADNMNGVPMDLGGGDQSGTIKFLPTQSGVFVVSITGSGIAGQSGETMGQSRTASAGCTVT